MRINPFDYIFNLTISHFVALLSSVQSTNGHHHHHHDHSDTEDEEESEYMDEDEVRWFENDEFTLFTFKNECDFSYKIQFDVVHCDSNLDLIDNFKISVFGNKVHFGSFGMGSMAKNYWNKMKHILLGHKFVEIRNWYIVAIQAIDTSMENIEQIRCFYLICGEVAGTQIDGGNTANSMKSRLMVWKTQFYTEQQPYGHE